MDVYCDRPFYPTIANFEVADLHLTKGQKFGEASSARREVVHVKDERFLNHSGARATKTDSHVHAIHYKPAPDRLNRLTEDEGVKERDEETLKKDRRDYIKLPVTFKEHRQIFLDMLTDFPSICDNDLGRKKITKNRIELLNNEVRPVHSVPHLARPTARKFCSG